MTGTWLPAFRSAPVSPYESMPLVYPPRGFHDQTLRQVVKVRAGGPRLRVRLSNVYGERPLTIACTRAAVLDAGSAIRPHTDTAVTFAGAVRVTVPAGEEVVSDPVELPTDGGTEVAVSTYHPTDTGLATYHPFALHTGYVTRGDAVSRHRLSEVEEVEPRFYLNGIDVWAPASRRVVAALGDSLTDGVGTTPGADRRYPDILAERLGGTDLTVANLGIAGNRLLSDVFGESGTARFDRDVLALPGVTHVVVELGLNDIGLPGMLGLPPLTADDLITGLSAITERAQRHGLAVIMATLTPFGGAAALAPGFDTPETEQTRQHVNHWIRTSHVPDAIADLDHVLGDPTAPSRLLPHLDSGDHLHPNDAGAAAIADEVARALLLLPR